ncbi:hypothetical protein [Clostridium estertheticum]|nr:hypothetical protein [Clostridium estertheticum]
MVISYRDLLLELMYKDIENIITRKEASILPKLHEWYANTFK